MDAYQWDVSHTVHDFHNVYKPIHTLANVGIVVDWILVDYWIKRTTNIYSTENRISPKYHHTYTKKKKKKNKMKKNV